MCDLQKKLRRVHMLDSDEEDEGEGVGADTAVGGAGEPAVTTPTGDDEDLSNDAENFSHVSSQFLIFRDDVRVDSMLAFNPCSALCVCVCQNGTPELL